MDGSLIVVMSTTVVGRITSSFIRSISVVPPPLNCTGAVTCASAGTEASETANAPSAGTS